MSSVIHQYLFLLVLGALGATFAVDFVGAQLDGVVLGIDAQLSTLGD